ncbi:MAG: hypothetical protein J6V48_11405 [Clostridia bacterium]|nr:hypothetical protein [Clostridia bacterium]
MATKEPEKKSSSEKPAHTYTKVEGKTGSKEELLAQTRKNAMPYRVLGIIFWILALTCEVFAVLFFKVALEWSVLYEEPGHTIAWIVALALDLIFLVVGSLLWKKGNHLDPAKKSQPVKFWCQNNLGVIVAAVAFIPFIILALTDKNASKKSKTIAAIAAAIALIIGVLFGIDWNPQSQEEMLENAGINTVYWTASGTVYHTHDDCQHIKNTVDLLTGTASAAIENGKTRLCKTCEKKDADLLEAAESVTTTDGGEKAVEDGTEGGGLEVVIPEDTTSG